MLKAREFCLPTRSTIVADGPDWLHEAKYDGVLELRYDGSSRSVRPVAAVGALVFLGALRWSGEWPERTLYDVSARLRFGRYQVKSGHGADISKLRLTLL